MLPGENCLRPDLHRDVLLSGHGRDHGTKIKTLHQIKAAVPDEHLWHDQGQIHPGTKAKELPLERDPMPKNHSGSGLPVPVPVGLMRKQQVPTTAPGEKISQKTSAENLRAFALASKVPDPGILRPLSEEGPGVLSVLRANRASENPARPIEMIGRSGLSKTGKVVHIHRALEINLHGLFKAIPAKKKDLSEKRIRQHLTGVNSKSHLAKRMNFQNPQRRSDRRRVIAIRKKDPFRKKNENPLFNPAS